MKQTITIIGNNGNGSKITDGGRIKIRLYKSILEREGYAVDLIDLCNWKFNFFSILFKIKKNIKRHDRIVIMGGPKGCRILIPLINLLNKKYKTQVVFCALGIGTLDALIKKYPYIVGQKMLTGEIKINKKDDKMAKNLSKLEYVVLENDVLKEIYEGIYCLKNIVVLQNFRDLVQPNRNFTLNNPLKIIYLSRVRKDKGILDLCEVVKKINLFSSNKIFLGIYGEDQLGVDEKNIFNSFLDGDIKYYGTIDTSLVKETLLRYDLFCLPTKYYGEGTPGSLIEAMICGTVPLISSYSQAKNLVEDKVNGYVFEICNKKSLEDKILEILENLENISKISKECLLKSEKFTYNFNKDIFLKYIGGFEK